MIPFSISIFLFIELLVVTYFDIKIRKIFNLWTLLNLLIYPLALYLFPDLYFFNWETFIIPLSWIGVGFILFKLRIMGAGDTKYLFGFFLLIPKVYQDEILLNLIYSTIVFGGSLFIYNLYNNIDAVVVGLKLKDFSVFRKYFGKKFAYAPVILISYIWFICTNYQKITF